MSLDYKRTVHGYVMRYGFHSMPMQRIPLADAYLFVLSHFRWNQGKQGLQPNHLSAHFNFPRNLLSLLKKIDACWHLSTNVGLQKEEDCMNLGFRQNTSSDQDKHSEHQCIGDWNSSQVPIPPSELYFEVQTYILHIRLGRFDVPPFLLVKCKSFCTLSPVSTSGRSMQRQDTVYSAWWYI